MEKDTGKKLKELREEHGLSQEKFADEIGVSRQIVSRWEKGKVIPNVSSVKKICDYYGISTSLLLNTNIPVGEDKEESQPVAKKKNKIRILIKGIAIFLLVLLTLYVIYSVYKYFLLKDLKEKFKEYDNWTNYYAEIRTLDEAKLTSKTEIWYRENKYKIITENILEDGRIIKKETYINCNEKTATKCDNMDKEKRIVNKMENMEVYQDGKYIKRFFYWIDNINEISIKKIFFEPIFAYKNKTNDGNTIFYINNIKLKLEKETSTPIYYIDYNLSNFSIKYYKITIGNVEENDTKIKEDL